MGVKQNHLGLRSQNQLMCNIVKNYATSKAQAFAGRGFSNRKSLIPPQD